MSAVEVVKDLKEYKAGTRDTYGQGAMMKGQATKLTDDQMNAVAILIEALPPVKTQEQKNAEERAKKITQEEIDYNNFMTTIILWRSTSEQAKIQMRHSKQQKKDMKSIKKY